MKDLIQAVTPWIAVIAAIVAGFLAYRNQLRLKAFELLLSRRSDVLKAVEDRMEFYRKILIELESDIQETASLTRFKETQFHEPLILYHRAHGVALGPIAGAMIDTYLQVCSETFIGTIKKKELKENIQRRINSLSMFYGFAHNRMSAEIESLATSPLKRILRLVGIREKLKVKKHPKGMNKLLNKTRMKDAEQAVPPDRQ